MTQRTLGRSGIEVSALGLGCSPLAGPSWSGATPLGRGQVNDEESVRALSCALDLGVNLIDTADSYGAGHSERVIAQAVAGRRSGVVLLTKFGNTFDEQTRQITGRDASPEHIRRACEASLRRLGTDYIDCYLFHWNDYPPEEAPMVRDELESLIRSGKIRSYGWSTDFDDRARAFAEGPGCSAIQHQMNVLDDAGSMVALCEELGLASINRGPLAMGLLTAKYAAGAQLPEDDVRGLRSPAWMTYFESGSPSPHWLRRRDAVREVLQSGGRSLAQGAIGWLWARSPLTLPIPGFKTLEQVRDNCAALEHGPLSSSQMSEIEQLLGR
jgi:aryl-alcohol dehydrogenase-like predicted oxidoreductase